MTALTNQINYFMNRALQINKKIGGKAAYYSQEKNKDKFLALKEDILKEFHLVKTKLEEKDNKKAGAEQIRLNIEINDRLDQIAATLEKMNDYIKKNPKHATQKNLTTYEYLKEQQMHYKSLLNPGDETSRPLKKNTPITITDIRAQLLSETPDKHNNQPRRVRKQDNKPTDIELEAMQRYEKNNKLIDDQVDGIIDKTKQWKKKAEEIGQAIDITTKKIDSLSASVDVVNKDLVNANKELKAIVQKFKKPHRFCIDVTLIIVLIGLVIGIIKFSQK